MKITGEIDNQENFGIYAEKKQEFRFLKTVRALRGQTLWEFDPKELVIREAPIVRGGGLTGMDGKIIKGGMKLTQKKGCLYFWALNLNNAKKKVASLIKDYYSHISNEIPEKTD